MTSSGRSPGFRIGTFKDCRTVLPARWGHRALRDCVGRNRTSL